MAPTAKALPTTDTPSADLASTLRIAIVHARWNRPIVDSLLAGAIEALKAGGVKEENIVVQSVPGSFELPLACHRVIAGSHVQAASGEVSNLDLLGGLTFSPSVGTPRSTTPLLGAKPAIAANTSSTSAFDAVIAIGVLIKGVTMHFEYISDTVSHGLMKVQLETGTPVIFGVLTALTDEQAEQRAGLGDGKVHNHGEDWGAAAIEMAVKAKNWREGKFL
ncbi:Lumazine synthase [Fistulina hepatica ATCC 64428]|nr:Lumazine synthase [Fistulina hepatica ATCC 64428]